MKNIIVRFVQAVKHIIQDTPLVVEVSEPFHEDGVWIVDFRCGDYTLVVQYSETAGFGLSTNPTDFSSSPDERFLDFTEATTRTIDLIRARGLTLPKVNVCSLRNDKTQSLVARMMGIKQPTYARMEAGCVAKFKVETIDRIVSTLGGRLHLVVESEDGRYFLLGDAGLTHTDAGSRKSDGAHVHSASGTPMGLVALPTTRLKASVKISDERPRNTHPYAAVRPPSLKSKSANDDFQTTKH